MLIVCSYSLSVAFVCDICLLMFISLEYCALSENSLAWFLHLFVLLFMFVFNFVFKEIYSVFEAFFSSYSLALTIAPNCTDLTRVVFKDLNLVFVLTRRTTSSFRSVNLRVKKYQKKTFCWQVGPLPASKVWTSAGAPSLPEVPAQVHRLDNQK